MKLENHLSQNCLAYTCSDTSVSNINANEHLVSCAIFSPTSGSLEELTICESIFASCPAIWKIIPASLDVRESLQHHCCNSETRHQPKQIGCGGVVQILQNPKRELLQWNPGRGKESTELGSMFAWSNHQGHGMW